MHLAGVGGAVVGGGIRGERRPRPYSVGLRRSRRSTRHMTQGTRYRSNGIIKKEHAPCKPTSAASPWCSATGFIEPTSESILPQPSTIPRPARGPAHRVARVLVTRTLTAARITCAIPVTLAVVVMITIMVALRRAGCITGNAMVPHDARCTMPEPMTLCTLHTRD